MSGEHSLQWLERLREDCLQLERDRGLRPRSVQELGRYLTDFVSYCGRHDVWSAEDLSPELLREFVMWRCAAGGPALVKGTVWSLRKLGGFLTLKQMVSHNPAAGLQHPKSSPSAKLPRYLRAQELQNLLETAATSRDLRDLTILSLMASTGMRPGDVAGLQRADISLSEQRVDHRTKGGWRKSTPLSVTMTRLLQRYLDSREDDSAAAFVNSRHKPVTKSWLQRMVRDAGESAGLDFRLTCNHLRHTFATHLADRHGKAVTKALLGHSGLSRTEVYMHLSVRRFRAVVRLHPYQHASGMGVRHG